MNITRRFFLKCASAAVAAAVVPINLVLRRKLSAVYVSSRTGNDANDGSTWKDAKATLADSLKSLEPGVTVYVLDGHHEVNGHDFTSGPAITVSPGTSVRFGKCTFGSPVMKSGEWLEC